MTSRAWFVSIMMLGSGQLAGCNPSHDSPTSPPAAFPDSALTASSAGHLSGIKVAMCHRRPDGTYQRLELPSTAAAPHRAHGDVAAGEAVPGTVSMVFNEDCTPVATTFVITSGSWVVDDLGRAVFDVGGPKLSAKGVWQFAERLGVCRSLCTTGQTIAVDALFDNPVPMTDIPQATGSATVANTTYPPPIEFGGPLRFVAQPFALPAFEPGAEAIITRTPFTLTGHLKGYLVVGRRDPLLVFDVPVSGHGTATVLYIRGYIFRSVRFDFEE